MATYIVPKEFLDLVQARGVSLRSSGSADFAFAPDVALDALRILHGGGIGVLGGEVWRRTGDRFTVTEDIWDVERGDFADPKTFVTASHELAERQVRKYLDQRDSVVVALSI